MEAAGQWCATDDETRASSFATYPLVDILCEAALAETLELGGQYFYVCNGLVGSVGCEN